MNCAFCSRPDGMQHGREDCISNLRADLAAAKIRGDGHAETLRSIAGMNASEGERMKQWAHDGLSGYVESTEKTMAQLSADLAAANKCIKDMSQGFRNLEADLAAERSAHAETKRELNRIDDLRCGEHQRREQAEAQLANVQRANMRQIETVRQAREAQSWAYNSRREMETQLRDTIKERDAARAQVERLRGAARDFIHNVKSHNVQGAGELCVQTDASFRELAQSLADTAPTAPTTAPKSMDEYLALTTEQKEALSKPTTA